MRISDWSSDVCSSDLEFAKVRQQFGQPIGRFQALQHRLVDMYVAESEARGMAATLPALFGMANRRSAAVSAAKGQRAEAGRLIAEDRKSVGEGKSVSVRVDAGGRGILKKKEKKTIRNSA